MSDHSPLKSSTSDASKTFAIPSRPSIAAKNGQKTPFRQIVDDNTEYSSEPEHQFPTQPYQQERYQPSADKAAVSTQSVRTSESLLSQPRQQSTELRSPESSFSQSAKWPAFSQSVQETALEQEARQPEPLSSQTIQRPASQDELRAPEVPVSQSVQWAASQQEARQPEPLSSREQLFQTAPTLALPVLRPLQPPQPPLPAMQNSPQSYQHDERSQLAPVLPPAHKKARRPLRAFYLALAIIAVVVVLGGLLSQQLLNGVNGSSAQNSALVFSGNGPYAQLPLNARQINAIQHLAGHMRYKALASLYVSHMSLDDEIGQLIMIEYNQTSYSSDLDYMINTLHVGGVIMYEFQMTSASQTKGDIAHMQQRANIPLLVSTDEEGGPYVHRLSNIYGYRMSATQIEQSGNLDVAKQQGLKTSRDLAALGINEDLAPDVDVNQVNGYDMVTRTFGNTPGQVIQYAGAYLQAMQGNGTVACIKHFPGLGGALTDAHKGLPVVNSTRQQIYDTDLAPFKAFIQSPNALLNPGMIMPTDVLLPAIDAKYPAELSHTFMTDILRNEFGYDGVSLTDALYMQGITNTWDMYTASVMALQAGNDMLLGANGTSQTLGVINAIKQALQNGQLTKARIDESVARIIALKMQYHLMPTYIPGA